MNGLNSLQFDLKIGVGYSLNSLFTQNVRALASFKF